MKERLLEFLICPACLPEELPLASTVDRMEGDDIISGRLLCKRCARRYPIDQGIAVLLPDTGSPLPPSQSRYEATAMVSSYLWCHYGDIFAHPEAGTAYSQWASHVAEGAPLAVDIGCAVGRFTFELSVNSDFAVGLDRSRAFIGLARQLLREGRLKFALITEGRLTEPRTIGLPDRWNRGRLEFIVGDALALPFAQESFGVLSSLNVLDKVPKPLKHLQEVNRVAAKAGARFLFSDPFSWSTDSALEADWLGGKALGKYAGNGLDNVRGLLRGRDGVLRPPWKIRDEGGIWWQIRNHQNHYEKIRSKFIVAVR